MKILTLMKYVPDTEVKIKLNESGGLDSSGFRWAINPYDEFALEEAVQIAEKNPGIETIVVSVAPKSSAEVMRKALAMGIDRGILIVQDTEVRIDSMEVAKALKVIVEREKPDLIIAGQRSIDSDNGHVLGMLAALLNWPNIQVTTKIEWLSASRLKVYREVEGGVQQTFEVSLPLVLGAHKSLNKPRFPSLPNIMKAKKKPLDEISFSELGVQHQSSLSIRSLRLPAAKSPCRVLQGKPTKELVKELVYELRTKAKVI